MLLRTLGHLELLADDGTPLGGRRMVLALLAWLARRRGTPADRERVATLLWEHHDTAHARRSLRQALSELRALLPADVLPPDADRLLIPPGLIQLDADQFEAEISAGRHAEALARYGGPFLDGLEDVGGAEWRAWLDAERAGLRRMLAGAFERAIETAGRMEGRAGAAEVAEHWVALEPDDERAHAALVTALVEARQPAAAAARHAAFLARLASQGDAPSNEFLRLGRDLPSDTTAGPRGRGLLSPDLIGRDELLETLATAWKTVQGGGARIVVVEGDEAVGKTRLVEEFVRRCARPEAPGRVAEARGFPAERNRPFGVLQALLTPLASAPGLPAADRRDLLALAAVAPAMRERFRAGTEEETSPIDEAFPRVLREIGAEAPILLVVDDADLADDDSQRALAALARHPAAGVLLLLTGKPGGWTGPLRELTSLPSDTVTWLRPASLGLQATRQLIQSMGPMAASAAGAVAEAALEEFGGAPGNTRALVVDLAERGILAPDQDGVWRLTGGLPRPAGFPAGMRAQQLARIQELSQSARLLLDLAAVADPRAGEEQLLAASGQTREQFREALGELLGRRLLRQPPTHPGVLEFANDASRRLVIDALPTPRRADLGAQLAVGGPARRASRRRWRLVASFGVLLAVGGATGLALRKPLASAGTTLVVADVLNLTGDAVFDRLMAWPISVELSESRHISVLPRSRIREVLVRMRRPGADSVFDEALAREVAEREGLPLVLAVEVEREGEGYRLQARLVRAASGDPARTLTATADSRNEIIAALGDLLQRTRRALGESAASLAANTPSLPQVTTPSLEALRAHTEAHDAWSRRDYGMARDRWNRAIELDSGFAMAWVGRSDYEYFYQNRPAGERYLRRALELNDRLTPREELVLRATAADRFGSPAEAIGHKRLLAERYPDRNTWYNLGTSLLRNSRCAEALPAFQRSLAYDSAFANTYINIATCHLIEERFDSAVGAYRQAERVDSTALRAGNVGEEYGRTLYRAGAPAEARAHFQRMTRGAGPENMARGHRALGWLDMLEGRYRNAESELRRALGLYVPTSSRYSVFRDRIVHAYALLGLGDSVRARRTFQAAWRERPDSMLSAGDYGRLLPLAARLGEAGAMAELVRHVEARRRRGVASDDREFATARAALLIHRRQYRAALEVLEEGGPAEFSATQRDVRWPQLAQALAGAGLLDSALAVWDQVRLRPSITFELQEMWQRADLEIARLAERMGRTAEAREAIERFVGRWKDADPELPELREALALRERLARGG